jgi:hypothetical protein
MDQHGGERSSDVHCSEAAWWPIWSKNMWLRFSMSSPGTYRLPHKSSTTDNIQVLTQLLYFRQSMCDPELPCSMRWGEDGKVKRRVRRLMRYHFPSLPSYQAGQQCIYNGQRSLGIFCGQYINTICVSLAFCNFSPTTTSTRHNYTHTFVFIECRHLQLRTKEDVDFLWFWTYEASCRLCRALPSSELNGQRQSCLCSELPTCEGNCWVVSTRFL